jgi:hypothetical protein
MNRAKRQEGKKAKRKGSKRKGKKGRARSFFAIQVFVNDGKLTQRLYFLIVTYARANDGW